MMPRRSLQELEGEKATCTANNKKKSSQEGSFPASPNHRPRSCDSSGNQADVQMEYVDDILAVATQVPEICFEDESGDVFVPRGVEFDPDAKHEFVPHKRHSRWFWITMGVILMVSAGTFLAVTLCRIPGPSKDAADPLANRDRVGIRSAIVDVFGEAAVSQDRAHQQALQWITQDDPMLLHPRDNPDNFLQRYVCAYTYYSTAPWKTPCGPATFDTASSGHSKGGITNAKNSQSSTLGNSICLYNFQNIPGATDKWGTSTQLEDATRWLSEFHECQWAGITCSKDMKIHRIEIRKSKSVKQELITISTLLHRIQSQVYIDRAHIF
jgi:hypothetical protein